MSSKQYGRESRPGRDTGFSTFVSDIHFNGTYMSITVRDSTGDLVEILGAIEKKDLITVLYDLQHNGLHLVPAEILVKAKELVEDE